MTEVEEDIDNDNNNNTHNPHPHPHPHPHHHHRNNNHPSSTTQAPMSNFPPRDLLKRFMAVNNNNNHHHHHQNHHNLPLPVVKLEKEEEEELELSLGLSMNGRFGVDPTAKKIKRTTSIPEFVRDEEMGYAVSMACTPLARTCSLPTETEEEWRKRKELQTLRRMEAKRKRSEKQRNLKALRERLGSEGNSNNPVEQVTGVLSEVNNNSSTSLGRTMSLTTRVCGLGLNGEKEKEKPPPSPTQGIGSSGTSESESHQGQGDMAPHHLSKKELKKRYEEAISKGVGKTTSKKAGSSSTVTAAQPIVQIRIAATPLTTVPSQLEAKAGRVNKKLRSDDTAAGAGKESPSIPPALPYTETILVTDAEEDGGPSLETRSQSVRRAHSTPSSSNPPPPVLAELIASAIPCPSDDSEHLWEAFVNGSLVSGRNPAHSLWDARFPIGPFVDQTIFFKEDEEKYASNNPVAMCRAMEMFGLRLSSMSQGLEKRLLDREKLLAELTSKNESLKKENETLDGEKQKEIDWVRELRKLVALMKETMRRSEDDLKSARDERHSAESRLTTAEEKCSYWENKVAKAEESSNALSLRKQELEVALQEANSNLESLKVKSQEDLAAAQQDVAVQYVEAFDLCKEQISALNPSVELNFEGLEPFGVVVDGQVVLPSESAENLTNVEAGPGIAGNTPSVGTPDVGAPEGTS